MARAVATIAFLIGFTLYVIIKYIIEHSKRGWETAKRVVETMEEERRRNSGANIVIDTDIDYNENHYHA